MTLNNYLLERQDIVDLITTKFNPQKFEAWYGNGCSFHMQCGGRQFRFDHRGNEQEFLDKLKNYLSEIQ